MHSFLTDQHLNYCPPTKIITFYQPGKYSVWSTSLYKFEGLNDAKTYGFTSKVHTGSQVRKVIMFGSRSYKFNKLHKSESLNITDI